MSLNETTLTLNLRHIKDSFTDRYSHPACLQLVMCENLNYELHDLLRHFYRQLPKKYNIHLDKCSHHLLQFSSLQMTTCERLPDKSCLVRFTAVGAVKCKILNWHDPAHLTSCGLCLEIGQFSYLPGFTIALLHPPTAPQFPASDWSAQLISGLWLADIRPWPPWIEQEAQCHRVQVYYHRCSLYYSDGAICL